MLINLETLLIWNIVALTKLDTRAWNILKTPHTYSFHHFCSHDHLFWLTVLKSATIWISIWSYNRLLSILSPYFNILHLLAEHHVSVIYLKFDTKQQDVFYAPPPLPVLLQDWKCCLFHTDCWFDVHQSVSLPCGLWKLISFLWSWLND